MTDIFLFIVQINYKTYHKLLEYSFIYICDQEILNKVSIFNFYKNFKIIIKIFFNLKYNKCLKK